MPFPAGGSGGDNGDSKNDEGVGAFSAFGWPMLVLYLALAGLGYLGNEM